MYSSVRSHAEGKRIEKFFNSNLVKFIFLITQYASGKMTKNEPLVANSITIPPEGVDDYYTFFDIASDKKHIEDILSHYKTPPPTVKESSPQFNEEKEEDEEGEEKEKEKLHATEKPKSKKKTLKSSDKCEAGKIFNPFTGRCIKNTPANQRKITLRQQGGKNKTFRQKHAKTKKRK
jgi:hypothetical protein